jgi:hypothetical protein
MRLTHEWPTPPVAEHPSGRQPRSPHSDFFEEDEDDYDDPTPQKRPTSTIDRRYPLETRRLPPERNHRWVLWVGIVLCLTGIGWIALSALGVWWHGVQENMAFGMPRTYQIDHFVGLGDSEASPDHFTAMNLNGLIVVVQINPVNPKADVIYYITRNNDRVTGVVLSFRDVNHDGKMDMLIQVGDDSSSYTIVFLNNGKQFVSQP